MGPGRANRLVMNDSLISIIEDANGASQDPQPPIKLNEAIAKLNSAKNIPKCLKDVIKEMASRIERVLEENIKLREENASVHRENCALRDKVALLETQLKEARQAVDTSSIDRNHASVVHESNDFHECERLRSVVISGVVESTSSNVRERLEHDFDSVKSILSFLEIEAIPVSTYRLGRPIDGGNRLLKVVLPSSLFQRLAVRRAHRLRNFSAKGVFLRESLTLAERNRRRELRTLRGSMGIPNAESRLYSQIVSRGLPAESDAHVAAQSHIGNGCLN